MEIIMTHGKSVVVPVELLAPIAAMWREASCHDLAPADDKHAWGFNMADLYWGDIRKLAEAAAPAPSSLAGGEGSRVPTIAWALAKATCGDAPTADDFKIARCVAAALSPEAPAREGAETGWLIEGYDSKRGAFMAQWWGLHADLDEDGQGWTTDSLKALRFSREADAQAYIDNVGWTEAKPTDHQWSDTSALTPRHEAPAPPCFECGSTERTGTACKPCNPEITDPNFGHEAPAEEAGEVWRDGPLSEALWMHFREVYGFDGDESIQSTSEIIAIIDRCARSSAPEARS